MESLKHWRKQAGFTQDELAERIGVSRLSVIRWETNEREPRAPEIKKLCEILHVTESELLNGPEDELRWKLKVRYVSEMPVIDIPPGKIVSDLHVMDTTSMTVTLAGPFELWEDEAKFEDFVNQLRREREFGLNIKRAREGK